MNKMIVLCVPLLFAVGCKSPDAPEKYRYQNKQMDLPYTDFKDDRAAAEKKAEQELQFYGRDACHEMGYGWVLDKIENPGTMSCEETPEGHHCRKKQVALVCRQRDDR
jgi:hypothetical protein